jgi:hypothetical protein
MGGTPLIDKEGREGRLSDVVSLLRRLISPRPGGKKDGYERSSTGNNYYFVYMR